MYIYNYDKITKEYCGKSEAMSNPLETELKGIFVPIIPFSSTEIQPPECEEGMVLVFENGNWVKKEDYRKQKQVEIRTKKISEIDYIGSVKSGFQLVDDEMALDIEKNPAKYKLIGEQLVNISNTDEFKQTQKQKNINFWNENFVLTTLGWLRINTSVGDLLSLLNSYEIIARISGQINEGCLLFYLTPDFNLEFTDEYIKSLQFWNSQISYEDFKIIFGEVAQNYLERFKG